jgi:hypothetical protein
MTKCNDILIPHILQSIKAGDYLHASCSDNIVARIDAIYDCKDFVFRLNAHFFQGDIFFESASGNILTEVEIPEIDVEELEIVQIQKEDTSYIFERTFQDKMLKSIGWYMEVDTSSDVCFRCGRFFSVMREMSK